MLDLDYALYDLAGNIRTITDAGGTGRDRSYVYDELHRLADASGGIPTETYGYDEVGNRTGRTVGAASESYAYDAASNRLLSVTGAATRSLTYSDSGNTSQDDRGGGTVLDYAYDSADRLVSVTQGAATVADYVHNAMGQRVAKIVGAATTHFLYDLSGRLVAEADGATGAATAEYIWLEGMPLAFVTGGAVYYIHADHLGTPQRLTDGTKAVVWDASYAPFGGATVSGSITFNLRFPGQYFDAETGLHYNYFRDYDASLGRYVQSDPIGLRGGWNTYAYVGGNPVMREDPKGLFKLDCPKCKWGPTVPDDLEQQAKVACAAAYGIITDPKLRACVLDRCNRSGKIKCTDRHSCAKPKKLGYNSWFLGRPISNTANVCVNHFPSDTVAFGLVVLHEFAHSCGWSHGDGGGVPGNGGKQHKVTGQ